ncbi:hypothetical protein Tco_1000192, partial [Tanacetum coccineum]
PDFNNDFEIFSNPLFDSNDDYTSSDDESSSEEDVPVENFKIYSNPFLEFDEEIFSKSLLNKDTVITFPKIDFLLEEFACELAFINPIPPGIAETNFDPKEDIFGEPRVHMPNVLPTHPTLCQDLDSTLSTDFIGFNLRFLSLNKCSISFISDPLSPVLETLLPFSFEIEDKVFNPGILVSKEEKSPHLLSHQGFKDFKIIHNFLNESPMMIYGGDMPILDDSPDYEDSRARGFV